MKRKFPDVEPWAEKLRVWKVSGEELIAVDTDQLRLGYGFPVCGLGVRGTSIGMHQAQWWKIHGREHAKLKWKLLFKF